MFLLTGKVEKSNNRCAKLIKNIFFIHLNFKKGEIENRHKEEYEFFYYKCETTNEKICNV